MSRPGLSQECDRLDQLLHVEHNLAVCNAFPGAYFELTVEVQRTPARQGDWRGRSLRSSPGALYLDRRRATVEHAFAQELQIAAISIKR
jgi:hypothetical protein